ncbi:hypothetical protein BGX38DRAFT_1278790 [Terfezia claveryi]|nr:hypothetical protein BGX38DRAFT_1281619 [Terfezia claveryi]KAF8427148.1 hypothetical protein BGX38DRAFT_1278790 [Terfezia claveryi]
MSTPDSQTTVADEIQVRQDAYESAPSIEDGLHILSNVVFQFAHRMESASNKLEQLPTRDQFGDRLQAVEDQLGNRMCLIEGRLQLVERRLDGFDIRLENLGATMLDISGKLDALTRILQGVASSI